MDETRGLLPNERCVNLFFFANVVFTKNCYYSNLFMLTHICNSHSSVGGPKAACVGCAGFATFSVLIEKFLDRHD